MTASRAPEHRPRRRALTPDEARVWRAVVRDVVPLPGRSVAEDDPPLPPSPEPAAPPPPLPPPPPVRVVLPPRSAAPPDLAHGRTAGIDKRTAERFRRGEMDIDGRLDLHGLTQDAAHAQLLAFVCRAFDGGRRCLLVITGKGRESGGVLRSAVPRWLNHTPLREKVLSFSYARPQHGGDGALYVLIKRRRE
ncbi:MAG: Smr/MutS family protein [Magnetospirillum sp.]|nr:Smr/MutS family protein [Magnetospirillum sp.]